MPAKAEAEAVVHDVGARLADAIGVPAIGVQRRPAVILVEGTVVGVRTTLGNKHDVRPAPQAQWAAGVVGF